MRLICFLFWCALVEVHLVCAEDTAMRDRFRALLDEEWQYTLRESPTFASHLGDKRYNDRWPDVSLAAIDRRHKHRQETLARMDQLDKQKLSPADQLNYQLFRKDIAEEIEAFQYRWHLVPLD